MHKLLGPLIVFAFGTATAARAADLPDLRLAPPPTVAGDPQLGRSLAFDAEAVSVSNAEVQSYRAGGAPGRTRADATGQTVAAELRSPLALTSGRLFLRPFIGAGGGLGTSSVMDGLAAHPSDGLIWTTKAGFYLRTSERIVWQLSYRHVETPDFDTKRSAFASRVSPSADVVGAELRFVLGR